MNKKILLIIIAVLLVFCLVACGETSTGDGKEPDGGKTPVVTPDDKPSDTPTDNPSDNPTDDGNGGDSGAQSPLEKELNLLNQNVFTVSFTTSGLTQTIVRDNGKASCSQVVLANTYPGLTEDTLRSFDVYQFNANDALEYKYSLDIEREVYSRTNGNGLTMTSFLENMIVPRMFWHEFIDDFTFENGSYTLTVENYEMNVGEGSPVVLDFTTTFIFDGTSLVGGEGTAYADGETIAWELTIGEGSVQLPTSFEIGNEDGPTVAPGEEQKPANPDEGTKPDVQPDGDEYFMVDVEEMRNALYAVVALQCDDFDFFFESTERVYKIYKDDSRVQANLVLQGNTYDHLYGFEQDGVVEVHYMKQGKDDYEKMDLNGATIVQELGMLTDFTNIFTECTEDFQFDGSENKYFFVRDSYEFNLGGTTVYLSDVVAEIAFEGGELKSFNLNAYDEDENQFTYSFLSHDTDVFFPGEEKPSNPGGDNPEVSVNYDMDENQYEQALAFGPMQNENFSVNVVISERVNVQNAPVEGEGGSSGEAPVVNYNTVRSFSYEKDGLKFAFSNRMFSSFLRVQYVFDQAYILTGVYTQTDPSVERYVYSTPSGADEREMSYYLNEPNVIFEVLQGRYSELVFRDNIYRLENISFTVEIEDVTYECTDVYAIVCFENGRMHSISYSGTALSGTKEYYLEVACHYGGTALPDAPGGKGDENDEYTVEIAEILNKLTDYTAFEKFRFQFQSNGFMELLEKDGNVVRYALERSNSFADYLYVFDGVGTVTECYYRTNEANQYELVGLSGVKIEDVLSRIGAYLDPLKGNLSEVYFDDIEYCYYLELKEAGFHLLDSVMNAVDVRYELRFRSGNPVLAHLKGYDGDGNEVVFDYILSEADVNLNVPEEAPPTKPSEDPYFRSYVMGTGEEFILDRECSYFEFLTEGNSVELSYDVRSFSVLALRPGQTVLTIMDNGEVFRKYTFNVEFVIPMPGELEVGGYYQIIFNILPYIDVHIEDTNVLSFERETAMITALAVGSTNVKFFMESDAEGEEHEYNVMVNVVNPVEEPTVKHYDSKYVEVGTELDHTSVWGASVAYGGEMSTSNDSVVTVNPSRGTFKCVAIGSAEIALWDTLGNKHVVVIYVTESTAPPEITQSFQGYVGESINLYEYYSEDIIFKDWSSTIKGVDIELETGIIYLNNTGKGIVTVVDGNDNRYYFEIAVEE